ncbi:MAG TPA: hypothetical protein VD846_08620 [Allosphingosinicella sp.]|nr:hypothetical protein [Allosphingosinicella sp.]
MTDITALSGQVLPVEVYNNDFAIHGPPITIIFRRFDLAQPFPDFNPDQANGQIGNTAATPFDINAKVLKRPNWNGAKIQITFADQWIYFRTDQLYITAGDTISQNYLRRDPAHPTSGKPREAIFYVQRYDGAQYLSYNLGLMVDGGTWQMPLFIDPKIENNG